MPDNADDSLILLARSLVSGFKLRRSSAGGCQMTRFTLPVFSSITSCRIIGLPSGVYLVSVIALLALRWRYFRHLSAGPKSLPVLVHRGRAFLYHRALEEAAEAFQFCQGLDLRLHKADQLRSFSRIS
ncbi:hypothetical protein [Bradyrhizobium lablabi]|uniref:hypothetical protein n=1 Tax=Bradyrhizobium lablabi TaxID=722472 RepID=UPI0012E3E802|nr:hypothetical protein [Bradyrhizobium lablabi]